MNRKFAEIHENKFLAYLDMLAATGILKKIKRKGNEK